ncbi:hypothetical protein HDU79_005558 [Rhizoclosmatium sp. JEL0117]|nr:hypothetical protein HDU79_005558 [Rhizoclosmatium sp. JEL0117]
MAGLDDVTKRQIAAAVFLGLVAVKAHHIVFNSGEGESLVAVWLALDAVYLLALKLSKTKRLMFSWIVTLGLFAILVLVDVAVVFGLTGNELVASVSDSFVSNSKQQFVGSGQVPLDSSHIQGSHLVKVVPPTIAKLNPNNAKHCISSSTVSSISINLQIKGTPPYTIDYEAITLDGKVKQFSNVSIASPAGSENKRGVALYPIVVTSPGLYRLTGLRDSTGMQGRVLDSLTEISACPDASWLVADPAHRTIDKCVDEEYGFSVKVKAAGPVQVFYSRKVGSEDVVMRLETNPGDDANNESTDIARRIWTGDETVTEKLREKIQAIKPKTTTISAMFKPETPGAYFFKLLYVMDGQNNTVVFPDPNSPPLATSTLTGNIVSAADRKPDIFVIDTHSHPSIRFTKSEAAKIRALVPGSSVKEGIATNLPIIIENAGSPPYTFKFSHSESLENAQANKYTKTWTQISDSAHFNIPATLPGIYTLHSVEDTHCKGTVGTPFENIVHQTFPPTISISAEAIEQSCVGTIGALVNVSLTGDAPFWIDYDEVYKGVRTRRTAKVNKLRDSLSFKPVLPGTYVYEFQEVGDATYTEGIPIDNVSITQIIHPQSEARFTNPQKLTRCIGDSATLPVTLSGSGPWKLTYEIIFETHKERVTLDRVEKSHLEIETPKFAAAGSYVVDLIEITDANGCSWLLETPDVGIEVLAQRPSGAFTCPKVVNLLEGDSVVIPIGLTGRQPFNVKYVKKENPGQVFELKGLTDRDSVRVNAAGTYEISEVSDMYCAGTARPVECQVKTIPRPRLEISAKEYETSSPEGVLVRQSICQGVDDGFEVLASGKAPFAISYTIDATDLATGQTHRLATKQDTSGGRVARIPLLTDTPNTYTYSFTHITDDNYKKPNNGAKAPLKLRQTILSRPNAVFVDGREKVFQCLGDNPEDTNSAVSIKLQGTAPFSLTLELKHENHPREVIRLNNINSNIHNFKPPTLSSTGKYGIQLVSISDATGCERVFDREDAASVISVAVSDVARIASLNKESVCVGDILSYTLQGTPPFTVTYEFDGVKQESVQIVDPLLTLYAAEPGTVKIAQVCNHMNCCTKPADLTTKVYNLPTAIVDGGEDRIEDIREGDETVIGIDFLGTPPFSFTYSRLDLSQASGSKSNKKASMSEESFTITNVETHHYDITTSQEGLFRVTAVYDKFCGFPRVPQAMGSANAVLKGAKKGAGGKE